ncbi:MAG: DUF6273 domain-containing protein [Planctomycetia bacterium]|nr:DUF6273 domain-containing protein [Planctomycetia bacterium]
MNTRATVEPLDIDAMSNAIREMISCCGVDVLNNKRRFQAAIEDLLCGNSLKTERTLLIISVQIGIGREMLKDINSALGSNRWKEVAQNLLIVEYGFTKKRSDSLIRAFQSVYEWHCRTSTLNSVNKTLNLLEFGGYEWRVLCEERDSILVVADKITDVGIAYNNNRTDPKSSAWEHCSLRKWLHSEFLDRFSDEDKKHILNHTIPPGTNPWFPTNPEGETNDMVFLLSVSEIVQCFGDSGLLGNRPPDARIIDDNFNGKRLAQYDGKSTWWWLRTPGNEAGKTAYVNAIGNIVMGGDWAFDDGGPDGAGVRPGVRPALWLKK